MKIKISYHLIERIIWLLTVFLLSSSKILDKNTNGGKIMLVITIIIFVLDIVQNDGKTNFVIGRYHLHITILSFFCFFSAIYASDRAAAVERGITIFEILVCMSVIFIHYCRQETINSLIDVLIWSGFFVAVYTFLYYGFDNLQNLIISGKRFTNDYANSNDIGMFISTSVVIYVYKILFINSKKSLSFIFLIPCIIIIAVSGSRKALVLLVIGVMLVLLFRFKSKNLIKTITNWIVLLSFSILIINLLSSLPIFKGINSRMEGLIALVTGNGKVDSSSLLRKQFIEIGMKQFFLKPFLGIGMNNTYYLTMEAVGKETYLHNNYVELLAGGGIIGFICYYSIFIDLIINIFNYRKTEHPYLKLCLVMILLQLIMDYGMVSYYSKSTNFYIMLFYLALKKVSENVEVDIQTNSEILI